LTYVVGPISGVASIWCDGGVGVVAHKMTRNTKLDNVHVAATELPQLLSQNTNMFGEATAQSRCQTLCSSEVNSKEIKLLEVEAARAVVHHSLRYQRVPKVRCQVE